MHHLNAPKTLKLLFVPQSPSIINAARNRSQTKMRRRTRSFNLSAFHHNMLIEKIFFQVEKSSTAVGFYLTFISDNKFNSAKYA